MNKAHHYTDGAILIRPLRLADEGTLYEAVCESIPELAATMSWCHPGYAIEESREFLELSEAAWEAETAFNFAVVDPGDGTYLGTCGINQINLFQQFGNLGYWVRTGHAGRNIATRATRLLAGFGFKELDLHRLEVVTLKENIASQRVAEKAGARREGILRNRLLLHEVPKDAVMFSLIPEDLVQP